MNNIVLLIKKNLPIPLNRLFRRIRDFFQWDSYFQKSWSQEGEDLVLSKLIGEKSNGFYIDVGAHHPLRFSNTFKFYKKGWRGINIDAMPGSMVVFNKIRKRDINLEIPVSSESKTLDYYIFNEPALNGFNAALSEQRIKLNSNYNIIRIIPLLTQTLSDILGKYLPENQEIDFLSIDVESLDIEVIKSNNWEKYKPRIILVEILNSTLTDIEASDIAIFLEKYNYRVVAKCVNTVFFKRMLN